jgi:hypothetical protein
MATGTHAVGAGRAHPRYLAAEAHEAERLRGVAS